jgi:methyl-accepting chemotaxis protein
MGKHYITRKFLAANIPFIAVIYLLRICLRAYGEVAYYNHGTIDGFISEITSFFLVFFLPSLAIIATALYFYMGPLDRVINALKAGAEVPERMMKQARSIIQKFPLYFIVLNVLIYIGGQIAVLFADNLFDVLFEARELSWLIFVFSSACLYAFGHITITNQVFAEARITLNMYHLEKNKTTANLRMRTVLLFAIILVYTASYLTRYIIVFLDKEQYYSTVVEELESGRITVTEAEKAYKEHLVSIMDPGADRSEAFGRIVFPYGTSTESTRMGLYVRFFLASFANIFLIGFLIVFLFSRELTLQIRAQRATIQDILSGKESLSKRISIVQYDEVGGVSDMINTLMAKLKDILIQVRESSITVGGSSESVNERLLNTTAAIEQMVAAIEQISTNVTHQVSVVENTKRKLETMLESIDGVTANIESEVSFIEETATAMQQMARNIASVNESTTKAHALSGALLDVSRDGEVLVRNTIEAIKKSKESTDRVLEITEMLSSISSETNILALNAAIEASHAGAAGRGFSVIASEVRKLSEKSARQANEITTYIREMAASVTNGVSMSEQAGNAFAKIDADIRTTSQLINQISNAMNEQKTGTEDILSSVDSVVRASSEVRTVALELKEQSRTIRDQMSELHHVSTLIDQAAREQEEGNREILSLVESVKSVSVKNLETVKKLRSIVEGFNIDSSTVDVS